MKLENSGIRGIARPTLVFGRDQAYQVTLELEELHRRVARLESPKIKLTERQEECLLALAELNAFSEKTRATGSRVASKAWNSGDENAAKSPLAELARLKLVNSRVGRGGGSWLSEHGQLALDELRENSRYR